MSYNCKDCGVPIPVLGVFNGKCLSCDNKRTKEIEIITNASDYLTASDLRSIIVYLELLKEDYLQVSKNKQDVHELTQKLRRFLFT